jgi:hypothetical protein
MAALFSHRMALSFAARARGESLPSVIDRVAKFTSISRAALDGRAPHYARRLKPLAAAFPPWPVPNTSPPRRSVITVGGVRVLAIRSGNTDRHETDEMRVLTGTALLRSDAQFIQDKEWQIAQSILMWVDSPPPCRSRP